MRMATIDLTPEQASKPSELLATRFKPATIRVHVDDFGAIRQGVKRECRTYRLRAHQLKDGDIAIVYASPGWRKTVKTCLVVVDDCWIEPLGAASQESWRLEGYDSYEAFREGFISRQSAGRRGGFRPLDDVQVIRLRPFTPEDHREAADALFERLFGRWA